ncbi:MAG: class I SAM-dependent methyltransferase [Hyphomicrobiaceae bacterium]
MDKAPLEEMFYRLQQRSTKWTSYFPVYQELLAPFAGKPVTIVEVGVLNGGSLFLWRELFGPDARIIGVDAAPGARRLEADGFEIYIGDQASPEFWAAFFGKVGDVDILIDDGGHTNKQQIVTLAAALDHIRDGGLLITEDTHTSYMAHFANPSRFSFMNFAYHVADSIQARNPFVPRGKGNAFAAAVYAVQIFESIVCLRIDRRRCEPARMVVAGERHIGAVDQRHAAHWEPENATLDRLAARLPGEPLRKLARRLLATFRGRVLRTQLALENLSLKSHF